jgi:hypothetical protein
MPDGSTYPKNSNEIEIDIDKFLGQLGDIDGAKDEVTSAAGNLRATIKAVLEEGGYHKAALAMIRNINDMPTTKKADCLRTVTPMFEAMRPIWEKQVQDMLDKADAESSEMEKDLGE